MSVQGGNFIGVFRIYPDPPHLLNSLNRYNHPLSAALRTPEPDKAIETQFIYSPQTPLSEAPKLVLFLRS